MKLILAICFLVSLQISLAQNEEYYTANLAIIQDQDGFSNVREKSNKNSKILYKLSEYEVFYFDEVSYDLNDEWISVYISNNKFTIGSSKENHISGFIHRSRIKPLRTLKNVNTNDFSIKYNIQKFDSSNIIVGYNEGFVETINGLPVWGKDGDLPNNCIRSIEVKIQNKFIQIQLFFYSDLYEANNKFYYIQFDSYYYAIQSNSDGAGHYSLVWVFKDDILVQRFVISMC